MTFSAKNDFDKKLYQLKRQLWAWCEGKWASFQALVVSNRLFIHSFLVSCTCVHAISSYKYIILNSKTYQNGLMNNIQEVSRFFFRYSINYNNQKSYTV